MLRLIVGLGVGAVFGCILGVVAATSAHRIQYGSSLDSNRESAAFAFNVDVIAAAMAQARTGSIVEVNARTLMRRSEIAEICLAGPYGVSAQGTIVNQRSTEDDGLSHILAGESDRTYWIYDVSRREAQITGTKGCRDLTATIVFQRCAGLVCISFADDTPLRNANVRQ